jgi:hypothetical protein
MTLNPSNIPPRTQQVLAGLFLSKFDTQGLKVLDCETFVEAFNLLGYGLGGKPGSIKNYRDEFDPLFPNPRKGWHRRPRRDYCSLVYEQYKDLNLSDFAGIITSFLGCADLELSAQAIPDYGQTSFAKRLATGIAAENYFQAVQPGIEQFKYYEVEDTTKLGYGYDFRLWNRQGPGYLAVEVKGLTEQKGSISFTEKEYVTATALGDKFFLFIVKNFRESPFHEIHKNPASSHLRFSKQERIVTQVAWMACA